MPYPLLVHDLPRGPSRSKGVSNFFNLFLFSMRHSLGFSFVWFSVVTIAEMLLTESDQARPPTSPNNSPLPIQITPDIISFNSYDSGNIFPIDTNPVASTPNGILSLDLNIAREPSNDKTESNVEPATVDADPDHSLPSCNLVSATSGRKLRREQEEQCVPSATTVPFRTQMKNLIHQVFGLVGEDPSENDTDQKENPPRPLTETEKKRIHQEDKAWEEKNEIGADGPYWNPCLWRNPKRPNALCCLGPSQRRTELQKRAQPIIIDMKNCEVYFLPRPMCKDPLIVHSGRYCCFRIDSFAPTGLGYMGLDCVPAFAEWRFDGISPFELLEGGGGTLP